MQSLKDETDWAQYLLGQAETNVSIQIRNYQKKNNEAETLTLETMRIAVMSLLLLPLIIMEWLPTIVIQVRRY